MTPPVQSKKYSNFYQFLFEEEYQEAYQKAYEEAYEEGRIQGQRQAAIRLFRKLAAKRFPDITIDNEIEAVEEIDQLIKLGVALPDIPDAKTLRRKLKALRTPVN